MKSVNNKYFVLGEIEEEENFTSYLVNDNERDQMYGFCILKNTFTYEKIQEYILKNFKTIQNYNFKQVMNLISIEIVYSIDGIKLERPQYGYLFEYSQNVIELKRYYNKLSSLKKLDLFMEICTTVNTLNMMGYIFDEFTERDVSVVKNNDGTHNIKINNLLQNEIRKFNLSNVSNNLSTYLQGMDKQEINEYSKSNIIDIILLFKRMFSYSELKSDLRSIRDIEKLYSQANTINKYSTIESLIEYVNEKMDKKYDIFFMEALNTIKTNLDLIGLEEEVKIVEKYFNGIAQNKQSYKVICFNGESGVGKTRLLQEFKERFEKKYFSKTIHIKTCVSKEEKYENYKREFRKVKDTDLINNYEVYINKFISLSIKNEEDINKIQVMQLVNRVGKFICDYAKSSPIVIIIDDLEKKNILIKMLLRYITFSTKGVENIFVIFSVNESDADKEFLDYLKDFKSIKCYEEYKINYLNKYTTTSMIQAMLRTKDELDTLYSKIYSETLGNPQYIKDTILELFNKRILYFNNKGKWRLKKNVKDVLIPEVLENRISNRLSSLNMNEIKVLKKLSIFKIPLPEKIIYKVLDNKNEREIYIGLKKKKYLIEKISDQGMLIGFKNNLVRNILYSKVEEKSMHEIACDSIEPILQESNYFIEEYIYHLEESNQIEKLFNYCRNYVIEQESLGNIKKAIEYLKVLLKYYEDKDAVKIAINIAKDYGKLSNSEKSYKYLQIAQSIPCKEKDIKIQTYIKLEMLIIKINLNSEVNLSIEDELKEIRKVLDEIEYPLGEAYYFYILSLKYKLEYNHDLTLEVLKKSIEICEKSNIYEDIYGWVLITSAICEMDCENYDKAKNNCQKSINVFSKNNNINGYFFSNIISISIEKDEGESIKNVLDKYLEINRLSNKYRVYKSEVFSLYNIAITYFEDEKYMKTEECLLKCLERQRDEEIDTYSISICNLLCILYIKLGEIHNAIKYYYLIKQMQRGINLTEDEVINTNAASALYNCMICNYTIGYNYLESIYEFVKDSKKFQNKNIECTYYELKLNCCKNENEIKNEYEMLVNKVNNLNRINLELSFKLRAIKRILLLGYRELAKEAFNNINEYPTDYNTKGIYYYLTLEFKEKSFYETIINKVLKECDYITNMQIKSDLYFIIGEKYRELKNYELEANYYYESLSIYLNIIKSLPENDKVIYMNNSEFFKVRNKFVKSIRDNFYIYINCTKVKKIQSSIEIDKIVNEINLENILRNNEIFKFVEKFYEKRYDNKLNSIFDVFETFTGNIITNLENILKYLAKITLSDKAMIVSEGNSENKVICSYRIEDEKEISKYSVLKHELEDEITIICNNDLRFEYLKNNNFNKYKACIYMKLKNKYNYIYSNIAVNATLILVANNSVNNINSNCKDILKKFKPFLTFLLEKYNLTIDSTLDKLTNVYNRKYFEESLRTLINTAKQNNEQFAVIMIDVDDFKGVNDKYGHQTGDEVLVKVTREAKNSLRKTDVIGRYGGEEFIILLPNCNSENAMMIAERIRSNVDNARILGDKRKVTVSIGVTISNNENLNSSVLIERADEALYEAKKSGKNRCILWRDENKQISNVNSEITSIITGNITNDYNILNYIQEIINLIKNDKNSENKIYEFIVKLMNLIECDIATIFMVKDKNIVNVYSKEINREGWHHLEKYNLELVEKIISEKKGQYLVDWDSMDKYSIHGIPEWKSLCIVPIIFCGEVLGVIYLSVSVNKKEFSYNEFNLLNYFAGISVPLFI